MDEEANVIRSDIEETKKSLSKKLGLLEGQVRGTVDDAKTTVESTIENIKNTVEKTVDNVKQTLDPIHQMKTHPWAMLGGSIVTGIAVGTWLAKRPARVFARTPGYLLENKKPTESTFTGYRPGEYSEPPETQEWQHRSLESQKAGPSLMDKLVEEFGDEIKMMKGIALGILVKTAAKQAIAAFPDLESDIGRVVKSAQTKLGNETEGKSDLGKEKNPSTDSKVRAI